MIRPCVVQLEENYIWCFVFVLFVQALGVDTEEDIYLLAQFFLKKGTETELEAEPEVDQQTVSTQEKPSEDTKQIDEEKPLDQDVAQAVGMTMEDDHMSETSSIRARKSGIYLIAIGTWKLFCACPEKHASKTSFCQLEKVKGRRFRISRKTNKQTNKTKTSRHLDCNVSVLLNSGEWPSRRSRF